MAVVSYTGVVLWLPAAIFRSTCSIDIKYFPFDIQTCKLKFGSWTYSGPKLNITYQDDANESIDISNYVDSNEWRLLGHPARRHDVYYPCCPNEPYPDVTFYITIQRIPIFFMTVLIIPCILLTVLTLVSFWLPPETPAKVLLGMNIFLAFFLLLKLLASSTPSSSSIPLLGAFFCINMFLITMSSFLSVLVINLYMRADKKNKVPAWLRKFAIDGLSRVLCMEQRKNIVPRKRNKPRDHVTHHVTHVIDDGAADGTRKSHVHAKTIKSPVLPYNKWDTGVAANATVGQATAGAHSVAYSKPAGGSGSGNGMTGSPLSTHLQVVLGDGTMGRPSGEPAGVIDIEVREMKRMLKSFMMKLQTREVKERTALEWRLVALSLDRMFFFIYLFTIVISIATVTIICVIRPMDHNGEAERPPADSVSV